MPNAGRDLLAALAYSYGPGFPADDVWPAVAAALSDTEVSYERLDAYWALDQYRRYVTASSLDGQAVYRLHQRLAEALRRDRDGAERELPRIAAAAVLREYQQFLQSGRRAFEHPYLWHYAWRHAVDGGPEGIEALKRLAALDPALGPDVAHALNALGAFYSGVGRRADAVAPTERAVAIYEVLAQENPAFLNDLAGSLNNLGACYSGVGRRADAVAPTERAVAIREVLAQENPAFLNDLAMSLNNLGNHYDEVRTPNEGTRRWTEVLERFTADPTTGVVLRLGRSRGDDEYDEPSATSSKPTRSTPARILVSRRSFAPRHARSATAIPGDSTCAGMRPPASRRHGCCSTTTPTRPPPTGSTPRRGRSRAPS
ncbi:MAG: tetratricopeptide repeat protein [Solirubrobacteraceae bacterium]